MSQARHDRLSELLIEALDLDEAARREFLERLRGEEPDLVDEVASLVDVDQNLETHFLAKPVLEDSAVLMESASDELQTVPQLSDGAVPYQVGPYRLLKLLGAGGMGKVFLAHQQEPIHRKVALKLIRSGFRDLTSRARFEAERQLLAQLEHPNIGRILDAGATDDGFPFFALELVDGEPLTGYCDRRSLSVEERLRIMVAVCRGVEHAHRKQIIHRDLKPSNILVAEVDGKPVPKIIDFGIAKSLDLEAVEGYEEDGELVVGTPAFMSPEAMDGSDDIDTRADVYSLGVLLYLLVAGRRPFDGEGLQDLVYRVTQEDPPPPSRRISAEQIDAETATRIAAERQATWKELRRLLRRDLDWILIQATARSRESRYGSASALADDLERYLEGRPVKARPSTLSYRFNKWAKRNRGTVVAGALLSILAAGSVVQGVIAERRTVRLTRASEELTREVERTEWRMRVANLLPIAERRSELESIRQSALRLRSRVPVLYADAEGPAEYALGRSALSLGELDEAGGRLESAWRLGYHRPEVALALGTTLGLLYERSLDAADRGPDAQTRRRLRERAEQELRAPALEKLAQAQTDLTLPDLIHSRIAFYRDDLERALNGSRAAFERRPSLFEAKFLEARILQRMSGREEDQDKADLLLEQSIDAAREGLAIARSSFEGHLRLCQARVALASHRVRYSRDGIEDAYRAGLAACSEAQIVAPGSSEVGLSSASVKIYFAEHLMWDRAEDPAEPLSEAREQLLTLGRGDASQKVAAEVQRLLGSISTIVAAHNERSGQDPMAAYSAAIEHLRTAQALQPGFYSVSSDLAHIFSRRANHDLNRGKDPTADIEQSIRFAQAAAADEPDELLAHVYLAQTLIFKSEHDAKRGRDPTESLDRADAALVTAQAIERGRITVLGTITAVRMIQGTWKLKVGVDPSTVLRQCVEVAQETLELFPEAAFPHLMGGQCHMYGAAWDALHGRSVERAAQASRIWYGRGFEKLPDMPGPQTELAQLALVEARLESGLGRSPIESARLALEHAERALRLDGERADAVRLKAEAQMLIADWRSRSGIFDDKGFEAAQRTIARAIEEQPDLAEHQLILAEILWLTSRSRPSPRRDEVDRGLAAAEKSLQIDGYDLRASAIRGSLLTLYPETEADGRRIIAEALDKNPSLAWTWRNSTYPK